MPLVSDYQQFTLQSFFKELEDTNVRYIVMRGFKDLPERIRTDLDIACHPDDQTTFYTIAKKHLSIECWPYLRHIQGNTCIYWSFEVIDKVPESEDRTPAHNIRMDLYNGIFWYHGRNYMSTQPLVDYIFTNRTRHLYFYIPTPEMDIGFSLLRCIYDKKKKLEDSGSQKYRDILETHMESASIDKITEFLKLLYPIHADIAMYMIDDVVQNIINKNYGNITTNIQRMIVFEQ